LTDGDVQQHVRIVFFGSTACAASTSDRTAKAIGDLSEALRAEADEAAFILSHLGVAIDSDADKGYQYLSSFGLFDEMITGNGWLNEAAVSYIWRQELAEPAVPQVLVLYREIRQEGRFLNVSNDSLLFQSVGVGQLEDRLASGKPFVER